MRRSRCGPLAAQSARVSFSASLICSSAFAVLAVRAIKTTFTVASSPQPATRSANLPNLHMQGYPDALAPLAERLTTFDVGPVHSFAPLTSNSPVLSRSNPNGLTKGTNRLQASTRAHASGACRGPLCGSHDGEPVGAWTRSTGARLSTTSQIARAPNHFGRVTSLEVAYRHVGRYCSALRRQVPPVALLTKTSCSAAARSV